MRLSATQAATGALTAAVVAGLLLLPGQLLGTDSGDRTVITLPVTTAPAAVQAQPVAAPKKPRRKRATRSHAAQPARVTTALVSQHPAASVRSTPVVHRTTTARASAKVARPALLARIVRSQATRTALARRAGRPSKHETPPDPLLPAAKTTATTTSAAPAAPAPTTTSPAPAPAPAPASPPAEAPASTPAPTTTSSQPTVVASVEQPAASSTSGNGLQRALGDHSHDGHDGDHGRSPWDSSRGNRGHDRGR